MTTHQLYRIWNKLLAQWLPHTRLTRRVNLIWLIVGLQLGGRVQASAIVNQWGLSAKSTSLTRRLSRFLSNAAVQPEVWYGPVAFRLLARWVGQTVTIIIDATRVGAGHQLVMVALAYRRRALPLAWTWVPHVKGHLSAAVQLALVRRVRSLVPAGVGVIFTGDSGFGSVGLMRELQAYGWGYVLRQTGKHQFRPAGQTDWQPLNSLVSRAGQQVWLADTPFTRRWAAITHILAYWAKGEAKAWLLTTNLPDARRARQAYARRMWIEEMFGDWKGHGWDIQTTHLRHPDRLSRLVLAIALLYVWLVFYGERLIKAGWRDWVDRHERRDLSLFRIGLAVLQRCLTLLCQPPVPLPSLVSGPSVR
jgi:Transposase DDE domain